MASVAFDFAGNSAIVGLEIAAALTAVVAGYYTYKNIYSAVNAYNSEANLKKAKEVEDFFIDCSLNPGSSK